MIVAIIKKIFNVGDQMLLTFWSFMLTVVLSRYFTVDDFYLYSMFFAIQAIFILIVNSSLGQLFLLDGKLYSSKSIIKCILAVTFFCYTIVFAVLLSGLIDLNTNFLNISLISISVSVFSLFELIRRYLYSLNDFKKSFFFTSILLLVFIGGIAVLFVFDNLNFRNLLFLNVVVYSVLSIVLLTTLKTRPDDEDKLILTLKEILHFNRWLLPGIFAYIITNQFFIVYLSNVGNKMDVINLRLTETVFGLILVFVAAFENYFIATLKELDFKSVVLKMLPSWVIFTIIPVFVALIINNLFDLLFKSTFVFSTQLITLILIFYVLSIISRMFVVYLRINKENKLIFIGNIFNSILIVGVLYFKIDLNLKSIFILKIIFVTFNLLIYLFPNIKLCLKKL